MKHAGTKRIRMKRASAIVVVILILGATLWLARGAAVDGRVGQIAEGPAGQAGMRFVPVDVVVDSGNGPLGAYQIEVTAKSAQIVGLEGGESAAFKNAPFYDPEALAGNRIIVAAFSTAEKLPTGATRVARLHLATTDAAGAGGAKGGGLPEMTSKLVVATNGDGQPIHAKMELRPMQGAE